MPRRDGKVRKFAILSVIWGALMLLVLAGGKDPSTPRDDSLDRRHIALIASDCVESSGQTRTMPEASLVGMLPMNLRSRRLPATGLGCRSPR